MRKSASEACETCEAWLLARTSLFQLVSETWLMCFNCCDWSFRHLKICFSTAFLSAIPNGAYLGLEEDYITEMTRPSFPEAQKKSFPMSFPTSPKRQVVSTYGFLLWLNHATGSDDSSCCMCTCGACFGVPSPPIFGINEDLADSSGKI